MRCEPLPPKKTITGDEPTVIKAAPALNLAEGGFPGGVTFTAIRCIP
jgi:hypothetical protein